MKSPTFRHIVLGGVLVLTAAPLSSFAHSQQGTGHGMMGPGQGMRQGMMGMHGMMGPGHCMTGMGHGMMGPGHSMMGPGHGMMGSGQGMVGHLGKFAMLDLSDEQRADLTRINDAQRKKHWELMGQMMDNQMQLRDLVATEDRDFEAIGKAYSGILDSKRAMIDFGKEARQQKHAVLTEKQRDRLAKMTSMRRHGMMSGTE